MQLGIKGFGGRPYAFIVGVEHGDDDFKGGDCHRPDDAVRIVILFDCRCRSAADADAVATHVDKLLFAVVVEEARLHRLGVTGAEFEDMTDFDAAPHLEHTAGAARAEIAVDDVAQISVEIRGEVAAGIGILEVEVRGIGADNNVAQTFDGEIGNDADGEADRPGIADRGARHLADQRFIGQGEFVGAEDLGQFDLVELVIAAQQHRHRLAICDKDQALHRLARRDLEKSRDLLDGALAGGGNLLQWAGITVLRCAKGPRLRLFDIGGILAAVAGNDGVFAGVSEDHEFVGIVAADGAGIGFDGPEVEAAAREDAAVGLVHLVVGSDGAGFVDIEGVGILHDEFPAAHQPEARADLVAKLGLDLIQVQRHLPVRAHFAANDIGHHLFMGRSHAEFRFFTVLEAQKLLAVLLPAP